jgi:hypothetical protein
MSNVKLKISAMELPTVYVDIIQKLQTITRENGNSSKTALFMALLDYANDDTKKFEQYLIDRQL